MSQLKVKVYEKSLLRDEARVGGWGGRGVWFGFVGAMLFKPEIWGRGAEVLLNSCCCVIQAGGGGDCYWILGAVYMSDICALLVHIQLYWFVKSWYGLTTPLYVWIIWLSLHPEQTQFIQCQASAQAVNRKWRLLVPLHAVPSQCADCC